MSLEEINVVFDTTLSNRQKYYAIYGEWVERKKAWREIRKLQLVAEHGGNEIPEIATSSVSNKRQIALLEDNCQVSDMILECNLNDLKDPKFLLEIHGYDPNKFSLLSASSSIWQQGRKDGDKELYSSKIKVKPIELEYAILETINNFCSYLPKEVVTRNENMDFKGSERHLEYVFTDLHMGLVAIDSETGENYDNSVLAYNIRNILEKLLIDLHSNIHPASITLAFLGDLLHFDNSKNSTTKGTPMGNSTSFQETYEFALNTLSFILKTILTASACPIHIVYVPGNHDEVLGYTLMATMKSLYEDYAANISFDIDQRSRKTTLIGNNLVGYMHGKVDKSRIGKWIYQECKPLISSASTIEIHSGHLHSEIVIEDNGLKVRYISTITGASKWEYDQAYFAKRTFTYFEWDNNNLTGIKYISNLK